jgi:5-methylcytosine-specific restriction endonuclease McrA
MLQLSPLRSCRVRPSRLEPLPRTPEARKRTGSYTRAAAQVRAGAIICHLCGEGPRPNDPWVADHLLPRMFGGSDDISNLAPAHQLCNGRRGASLRI